MENGKVEKLLTDSGIKAETAEKVVGEVVEMVKKDRKEAMTLEIMAELGIPVSKTKGKPVVTQVKSFEDWNKPNLYKTTFLRPNGAIVFECSPLGNNDVEKIQDACRINPPKKAKVHPVTGKVVKNDQGIVQYEDDLEDKEYIKQKMDMVKKEKLLTLEASMPHLKIPGKDWKERWNNLGKQGIPAGEIERLYNYIVIELTGYSGLISPFVNG